MSEQDDARFAEIARQMQDDAVREMHETLRATADHVRLRDHAACKPAREEWVTTGIAGLAAGWRNIYREDDGTLMEEPCPALLLQENRGTWCTPPPPAEQTSHFAPAAPPYDTRVVPADLADGWCDAACSNSNYLGTIPPGAEPHLGEHDVLGWRMP